MQGFNEDHDSGPVEGHFAYSSRRRRSRGPSARVVAASIGVLLVLVTGWFLFRSGEEPPPLSPAPVTAAPDPDDARDELDVPPLDLPPLNESDGFVRGLVTRLSSRPQLASWLVSDALVHRFVLSVANLSGGMSPAPELEDLAPEGEFRTLQSDGREVIDPASYRRYDAFAETFASLDTQGTAQLYHQLHPLFEDAWRALGIQGVAFDDAVARAVGNLLAVQVRDTRHEVELDEGVYVFADPSLEARTPAEKHLVRMGPENARLFQLKLEELISAIGIRVAPAR